MQTLSRAAHYRGLADSRTSYSKYMEHFPTLFLYSHLALRHLVNTRLRVSQTIEMARSDAAVQKASKENIVKKVKTFGMALNTVIRK